jgi:hypothetical protein
MQPAWLTWWHEHPTEIPCGESHSRQSCALLSHFPAIRELLCGVVVHLIPKEPVSFTGCKDRSAGSTTPL